MSFLPVPLYFCVLIWSCRDLGPALGSFPLSISIQAQSGSLGDILAHAFFIFLHFFSASGSFQLYYIGEIFYSDNFEETKIIITRIMPRSDGVKSCILSAIYLIERPCISEAAIPDFVDDLLRMGFILTGRPCPY